MTELGCPQCGRDFEIPRRYLIKLDDYEYLPVPRILNCLHSICHSCVEEMFQRSAACTITCPVCRNEQTIKGAMYLPPNYLTLNEIVQTSSSRIMSNCSRCYDESASHSWCKTCNSALCEFHHQDHKLSLDTAKHEIMTFKEINHRKIAIKAKVPPIPCPQVPIQDSCIYCRSCKHVVSVQGMAEHHKGHDRVNCQDAFTQDVYPTFESVMSNSSNREKVLAKSIQEIRVTLDELDGDEISAARDINKHFAVIREEVVLREQQLLNRVQKLVGRKRSALKSQLSALSELLEDTQYEMHMAHEMISGADADPVQRLYAVAAMETFRCREANLSSKLKGASLQPTVDPTINAIFNSEDSSLILSRY